MSITWQKECVSIILSPVFASSIGNVDLLDPHCQVVETALFNSSATFASENVSPLSFVVSAYKRCEELHRGSIPYNLQQLLRQEARGSSNVSSENQLKQACELLRSQLLSYSILAVTSPDLFGFEYPSASSKVPPAIAAAGGGPGHFNLMRCMIAEESYSSSSSSSSLPTFSMDPPLPPNFLSNLVQHIGSQVSGGKLLYQNEDFRAVFSPIIAGLSSSLAPRSFFVDTVTGLDGVESPQMSGVGISPEAIKFRERLQAELAFASGLRDSMPESPFVIPSKETYPTLMNVKSFVPQFRALNALLNFTDIIQLLFDDPNAGWGHSVLKTNQESNSSSQSSSSALPNDISATGRTLETETFLGRVLSLGPQRSDFLIAGRDLIAELAKLPSTGARDGEDGGDDNEDGDEGVIAQGGAAFSAGSDTSMSSSTIFGLSRVLPPRLSEEEIKLKRNEVTGVLNSIVATLREGNAIYISHARVIIKRIAVSKTKVGRENLFAWMGKLIDANNLRNQMAFAQIASGVPALLTLSSGTLISNAALTMIALCEPFIEPSDPKSCKIDLRYVSAFGAPNGNGGGRFSCTKDERLAPLLNIESQTHDENSGVTASWLDARNLARQQQFFQTQEALKKEAIKGYFSSPSHPQSQPYSDLSTVSTSSSLHPGNTSTSTPVAYSPITEMFWIAVRLVHIGHLGAHARESERAKQMKQMLGHMTRAVNLLRSFPNNGFNAGTRTFGYQVMDMYGQMRRLQNNVVEKLIEIDSSESVWLSDENPRSHEPILQLYRLLAVVIMRCAVPEHHRFLTGLTYTSQTVDIPVSSPLANPSSSPLAHPSSSPRSFTSSSANVPLPTLQLTPQRLPAPPNVSASSSEARLTVPPPPLPVPSPTPLFSPSVPPLPSILPLPQPSLPLALPVNVLCALPKHLVEDIGTYILRLHRHWKLRRLLLFDIGYLSNINVASDFLNFFVSLISSPLHVANPYSRGLLVNALSAFVPVSGDPWRVNDSNANGSSGAFGASPMTQMPPFHQAIFNHDLSSAHLLPVLCAFHVDIGLSGSHTVFYDKHNYRYATSEIIEYLVQVSAPHRLSLLGFANDPTTGPSRFLRFANEVISDADYFMGEALKFLEEVRGVERRQFGDNTSASSVGIFCAEWNSMTPDARAEQEKLLTQYIGQAKHSLFSARIQIHLIAVLIKCGITHVWLTRRLRDRVAGCLGYYLDALCGKKRTHLKITAKNMALVEFKPREILFELADALASLAAAGPRAGAEPDEGGSMWSSFVSVGDEVAAAAAATSSVRVSPSGDADILASVLARDERSFHIENYREAANLLRDPRILSIRPQSTLVAHRLEELTLRLSKALLAIKASEEELGELPDDVADPLLSDLMTDPVMLPASRVVCQRDSILHQLLSEDRDPFSRAFLRADMLIPMPKTKAAILAWAAAKKAQSLSPSKLLEDNTAAALNNVIKIKEIEIKELREKIEPAKPKPDEMTGALAPLDSDILHEDDDELARALMMSMASPSSGASSNEHMVVSPTSAESNTNEMGSGSDD